MSLTVYILIFLNASDKGNFKSVYFYSSSTKVYSFPLLFAYLGYILTHFYFFNSQKLIKKINKQFMPSFTLGVPTFIKLY